ncbi:MAG: hypothetical protein R3E32_29555 [Chitinophagales bacterium]
MKNILIIVLVAVVAVGGYFAYQQFVVDNSISILESVQHELAATEEFVFSRDKLSFTKTEHREKLLAHVDYLYTWDASVPFGFASKDMQLSYDKNEKRLSVLVNDLQLYPLSISNKQSKITSIFAWMDKSLPAKEFWEKVESYTKKEVSNQFTKDASLRKDMANITKNSVIVSIRSILDKLGMSNIQVAVEIKNLKLYNGKRVGVQ